MRLLTLHNLAFVQRLMAELRDAIDAGRFAEAAARPCAPAPPGAARASTGSVRRVGRRSRTAVSLRVVARPGP